MLENENAPLLNDPPHTLHHTAALVAREAVYRTQITDETKKSLKRAYHSAAWGSYLPETFFALFAYFATNLGFQVVASSYAANNASGNYSPTQQISIGVALVTSFADFLVNLGVIHPKKHAEELSKYVRTETTYEGLLRIEFESVAAAAVNDFAALEEGSAPPGGAVAEPGAAGGNPAEDAAAILAGCTSTEEIQGKMRILVQIFPIFLGYVAGTLGNLLFLAQDKKESPSFLQGLVGKMQEQPGVVWGLVPFIVPVGCVYYAMYSYTRMLAGANILAQGEYGNRKNLSGSMEAWLENFLASSFRGTGFGAITEIFLRSSYYTNLSNAWKWPLYGFGTFLGVTNTFLRSVPKTHNRYIGSNKVLGRIAAPETNYFNHARTAYNAEKTVAGVNQSALLRTLPFTGFGFMSYFLTLQHLDEAKMENQLISAGVGIVLGFAVLALRFIQAREMEVMRIARAYASADLHNEAADWCNQNFDPTIGAARGLIAQGRNEEAKATCKQYDQIAALRDAYAKEANAVLDPQADSYRAAPDTANLLSSVSRCLSIILGLTYIYNAFDDPRAAVSVSLPFMIMATVLNYNYNKDDVRESWDGIKSMCRAAPGA